MPSILPQTAPASALLNSARPCGRSAKADLTPHTPACDLRGPAKDALKATVKQESAAAEAGLSQSRLSHKFADGTLTVKEMEAFGPAFAVKFGEGLIEQFAPLATPKARAYQKLREIELATSELRQLVEHL